MGFSRYKPDRRHFKRGADYEKKVGFIKAFKKGVKMLNGVTEQHDIRLQNKPALLALPVDAVHLGTSSLRMCSSP